MDGFLFGVGEEPRLAPGDVLGHEDGCDDGVDNCEAALLREREHKFGKTC